MMTRSLLLYSMHFCDIHTTQIWDFARAAFMSCARNHLFLSESQHQTHNIYQRKLLLSDFQSCCHIHLKVSEVSEINKVHLLSAKLDGVKTYMRLRRVPNSLQNKVIKWFDYLWLTQKSSDEEKAVSCLPGTLYCHFYLVIFRD